MLRKVTEIPPSLGKGRESYVARDIIDFAQSDMAVAELVVEGKKWRNVYKAARYWMARHPDLCPGVAVTRRGERVFLVREVAE